MKPEEAERVMDLVAKARAFAPDRQTAFLAEACAGDEALLAEVESLLRFRAQAAKFLEAPAFEHGMRLLVENAKGERKAGDTLGDCRLVSLLGVGGMGEVYLAEDTIHRRRVALKLIGQSRSQEVRGRHFRHERRMLAALSHPHIARLYDSGVTEKGEAYLVMEYVEGERLDRYCDMHGLGVSARVALFRKVCAAVAYAHQNLVVHRDLKPANIRVTPEGEPKLLDFGIAKLLDPESGTAGAADPTVTIHAAMTPEYASPEQLQGATITTASDVYSLGVVLYELLCGQRPFAHLKSRRPDELARAISEQEPPRPSTVAAHTAPTTATETVPNGQVSASREFAGKWRRQLEGDLDNIVAKALRKEPGRRYPSVLALSEDLRRHCEGLPITARKDTLGYRTGKFVRRNKVGMAAAGLLVLALLGGLATTMWQAHVAKQERDRARISQRQSEHLNGFLEDLLASADPTRMGKDVRVVEVLDAAGAKLDTELANEPEILAQAHETLCRSYRNLGLYEPAERQARAALAAIRSVHGPEDPAVAQDEFLLGAVVASRNRQMAEAEALLRHALAVQSAQPVPDHAALANTLSSLAYCLSFQPARSAEAATPMDEALAHARTAWGEHSLNYLGVLNRAGSVRVGSWDYAGGAEILRQVITLQDQLTPGGPANLSPQWNLCICLFNLSRLDEMEGVLNRLEADSLRLVGEGSVQFAIAKGVRACLDFARGEYGAAVPCLRQALKTLDATFPPDQVTVVQCRGLLGLCLTRDGHAAEGETDLRAAYEHSGKLDRRHFDHTYGNLETALGECLLAQKRCAEAEPLLLTGHDDLEKRLGAQNVLSVQAKHRLHDLYLVWNKPVEAACFADNPTAQSSPIP